MKMTEDRVKRVGRDIARSAAEKMLEPWKLLLYMNSPMNSFVNGTSSTTPGVAENDPTDPFQSFIPQQTQALTGDSSVTPPDGNGNQNFSFAVPRVRMRGSSPAMVVMVFFRLWDAPTNDTGYQPSSTYPRVMDTQGYP